MRILIINLTRLGDILQSTPLLRALKEKYPQVEIHYLAVDNFAEVCRYIPEIDQIIPFDFGSAIAVSKDAVRSLPRRLQEVEAFIESLRGQIFDVVINLSHSRISALLCHLLNAPDTRGLTLDREGYRQIRHPWARHFFTANLNRAFNRFNLVDLYLGLADEAENSPSASQQMHGKHSLSFQIPAAARHKAAQLLQGWGGSSASIKIGFQPGASLASKRWPAESFVAVGKLLRDQMAASILVFGSSAEEKLTAGVAEPLGGGALNLAGKTDIATLGALLNQADLLITNDTGTQHLAAAVGTKVLSLCFGSALSHETGPYGCEHRVVESTLPCYPCSFHVDCQRFRCQEQVSPEAIFRLAQSMVCAREITQASIEQDSPYRDLNVWRTGFDSDGFWIQRPLIARPLTALSFFNLASRFIWKEVLSNIGQADAGKGSRLGAQILDANDYLPPRQPEFSAEIGSCLMALQQLDDLALKGQQISTELATASSFPGTNLPGIKSLADALSDLDKEIAIIGSQFPTINNLVLDFIWGKENLQGNQVHQLAAQIGRLYQRLGDVARRLQSALSHNDLYIRQCSESHVVSAAN